ncbi:hypothetical protein COLO4_02412 [Corchorus olitorius]|uniref:Uncharacterized protein n=1 Tax=Corchorus olitorius TaxID=93759 RepID=A0A1R3L0Z9_9ROSI|nr:hypothetical protein COLO4_02412 [Corchorus olitorius]
MHHAHRSAQLEPAAPDEADNEKLNDAEPAAAVLPAPRQTKGRAAVAPKESPAAECRLG